MHRTIASITATDATSVVVAIAAAGGVASAAGRAANPPSITADRADVVPDLVEVRLDALWRTGPATASDMDAATDDLVAVTDAARAAGIALLATLRPKRQGGAFDGDEQVRLGLLAASAAAGFAAVDVEADHADDEAVIAAITHIGCRRDQVILSDHTLPAAPSRDEGLVRLLRMQDLGCGAEKLAFACGSFVDTLRALELCHAHSIRHGRPGVTPVGAGAEVRAMLAVVGNRLTYGHATGQEPAVAGQPSIRAVQRTWTHWGLLPPDLGRADGPPWLAVIGHPVAHSRSPRMHNAALRAAGRPERFVALDVPDSAGAVRLLTRVASRIGLVGASVTAPLKHHALDVADHADDRAREVGAANCIRFSDGVQATNTDTTALERILTAHTGSVVVLGGGGAARAAIAAARRLGRDIAFTSRDEARARAVEKAFGCTWTPWDDRARMRGDVWVQATPIGATADAAPVGVASLSGATALVEMVYAGGPTPLQRAAESEGVAVHDGIEVLVEQAADAFLFWTAAQPDRSVMMRAARSEIGVGA